MKIIVRQDTSILNEKRYWVNIYPNYSDQGYKDPKARFYDSVSLASVERLRKIRGKNIQMDIWL